MKFSYSNTLKYLGCGKPGNLSSGMPLTSQVRGLPVHVFSLFWQPFSSDCVKTQSENPFPSCQKERFLQ